MAMKGRIGTIQLSDIFQMLAMSAESQTLTVRRADERKAFFFTQNGVTVYFFGGLQAVHMGEILVNLGRVTEEQLQEAISKQDFSPPRLGEILVHKGFATQEDINIAVRRQIEEELYELLSWDQGDFEVTDGPPPADQIKDPENVIQLTFDVTGVLMEAARRMDELEALARTVPSLDDVYVWQDGSSPGTVSCEKAWQQRMSQLFDRRMTVHKIIEHLSLSRFDATEFLARLVGENAVRALSADELRELGAEALSNGETAEGLRIAERVVRMKSDDVELRLKLAHIYERLDRKPKTVFHLLAAADICAEHNELDQGLTHLNKAFALDRQNPEIRERLMQLHLARSDAKQAARIGTELLVTYLAARSQEAGAHARKILEIAPSDEGLWFRVIGLLSQYRRVAEARDILLAMPETILDAHGTAVASICRSILDIDPSMKDVAQLLARTQSGDISKVRRRRLLDGIVTGFVAVICLVLAIYFLWRAFGPGG